MASILRTTNDSPSPRDSSVANGVFFMQNGCGSVGDYDLKVLESVKKFVETRSKNEKELVTTLTSIVKNNLNRLSKNGDSTNKVRTFIDDAESLIAIVRNSFELIESTILDKINQLIVSVRDNKKAINDECNRIMSHSYLLQSALQKVKNEYLKAVENYNQNHAKYQEVLSKGKGSKRIDDARDKLQKAAKKLHIIHNDYVLLVCEGNAFKECVIALADSKFLDILQPTGEELLNQWRQIVRDLGYNLESKSKELSFRNSMSNLFESQSLWDLKRNEILKSLDFSFDSSVFENLDLSFPSDKLIMNDLTAQLLKNKMEEAINKVSSIRSQLKEKEDSLSLYKGDESNLTMKSRKVVDSLRREIGELMCTEKMCQSQVELITTCLAEFECREAPVVPQISPPVKTLQEEEWFHGVLPREEVVRLLCNDGDFLVRETMRNEERQIVLSVSWGGHKHFIVQTTSEGLFRFEGPAFPTIQELIIHQYQSGNPVTTKSGAILKRPVYRERWELNNDDVELLEKIGKGNFGDVFKARLKSSNRDVAVKTCRVTLPDEQKKKFLQEGRILKEYDHPNIVKFIGICVQKQPIMIVMELVSGGSLLNFLRLRASELTVPLLVGMCRDTAAGMEYLENKNCIHRDLAARNCLIDLNKSVKISDFGMSREEKEYIVSDGMKQIPIKWTAPEALNYGKYTSQCDVWSYGVLCWEIFSKGGVPYSGLSNAKARELIDAGYRMPPPEATPHEIHRLMEKCWCYEAEGRPHFNEILTIVTSIYEKLTKD
ncbi:hypothetical protein QYM36_007368 [Artemia franciscana]|uniref:Tyrosine-protein kinase n=2 Tax=Artemia franciscana TaxID=6661 RepID=A0AA88LD80_ARTSF|nr:hypothetical protein QYM36_007368 [Artemia franciscana]